MNRRHFTTSVIALAATPALPASSIAAHSGQSAGQITSFAYTCARHYAQMMGEASPARLVKEFGITPQAAQNITAQLIRQGILLAPNAAGLSRAAIAQSPAKLDVTRKLPHLAKQLLEDEAPAPADARPDEA